jgi:hypothetical protein
MGRLRSECGLRSPHPGCSANSDRVPRGAQAQCRASAGNRSCRPYHWYQLQKCHYPHKRDEVAAVLNTARERAEVKGTTVEHEIDRAAEWRAKSRKAAEQEQDRRRRELTMRYIEIEGSRRVQSNHAETDKSFLTERSP